MGLSGWFLHRFRSKEAEAKPDRTGIRLDVEVVAERRPAGSESTFATPASVVEEAFDQIMTEVDVPEDARVRLKPLFVEAHRSADPRREVEAIKAVLDGVKWGDLYFGAWRERFEADGAYPYMWKTRGKALISDPPRPPSTIEDAVGYLRVVDMRRLLIDLGAMPGKDRPKRRSEFIALLSVTGKAEEIIDAAAPGFRDACDKWEKDRNGAKCELLAHTLTIHTSALRDRRKRERLPDAVRLRAFKSDCPVETEYAARFLAGEIGGIPPFFPGDRTSLVAEFDDEI